MALTDIVLYLFQPEDLVRWPQEWPEGFGAAAAVEDGRSVLGVVAFHPGEKPGDAVARLARRLGLPVLLTPVHPSVTGLTRASVDRGEELRARDALSSLLGNDPEIVEAAADFALNFEFAISEGLSLHAHLPGPDGVPEPPEPLIPPAPAEPEQPAGADSRAPSGFIPLPEKDEAPVVLRGATISGFGPGECLLELDRPGRGMTATARKDWSVSLDGTRHAIPLARVMVDGRLPASILMPFRSPALLGNRPVPAEVTLCHGWLFMSVEQVQELRPQARVKPPRSGLMRALPALFGQVAILLVTAGLLVVLAADRIEPRDPVEALRKGLFETGAPVGAGAAPRLSETP